MQIEKVICLSWSWNRHYQLLVGFAKLKMLAQDRNFEKGQRSEGIDPSRGFTWFKKIQNTQVIDAEGSYLCEGK